MTSSYLETPIDERIDAWIVALFFCLNSCLPGIGLCLQRQRLKDIGKEATETISYLYHPGEISMEKVKVKRYVSGKRPDYAPMESSDEEDEEFQFIKKAKEQEAEPEEQEEDSSSDPRLRRLQNRISEDVEER